MRWSWLGLVLSHTLALLAGLALAIGLYAVAWATLAAAAIQTIMAVTWTLQHGAREERARMTMTAKRARRKRRLLQALRRERGQH